jgi:Xaa-Pro aminopeptidase
MDLMSAPSSRLSHEVLSSALRARRAAIVGALGDTPALVFSGVAAPRNYAAATYRFRAASHFLYLVGSQLPGAALLLERERTTLFVVPDAPDDALWHGASPSWSSLAASTLVDEIVDIAELPRVIAARGGAAKIATVPAIDVATRFAQGRLLDREWGEPGVRPALRDHDASLADALVACRMRHDTAALAGLRLAAEGTVAAHLAGMAATRPGITAHVVRAAMEHALHVRGMEPSYLPIVTPHGEILHSNDYDLGIADGDLLLADVGAEADGWAGDVTRTWPVSGRFSATQRAVYDLVLAAQHAAIDRVRPGVRYRDAHLAAARVLAQGLVDEGILRGDPDGLVEQGAHALFFPHGIGHLLGLDVHDMEDLGDVAGYARGRTRSPQFGLGYLRLDRDLEPDMVVTIEPGFYVVPAILEHPELGRRFADSGVFVPERLARFGDVRGIRIEDDVRCTSGAPEVLTSALPKDATAIETLVGTAP